MSAAEIERYPYKIEKRGEKYCVVGPSRTHGCHDSRAKAIKQQRALYTKAPTSVILSSSAVGATLSAMSATAFASTAAPEIDTSADSQEPENGRLRWEGVLGLEGHPTSDGRMLIPNEIGERDLPVPFCVQTKTAEGHEGAENCGRIEMVSHVPFADFDRAEEFGVEPKMPDKAIVIWGEGTFDGSEWTDEALRMIENGADVSLDIPRDRLSLFDPETLEEIEDQDSLELEDILFGDYLQGLAGKIGGATIVNIGAFEHASVKVIEDKILVASGGMIKVIRPQVSLVAAAGPLKPPREWFEDPQLGELTPLQITKEGRVFGHLADWDGCHIGFQGICVPPFRSLSGYAYFNTGEIECSNGDLLPCGKIMFCREGNGHAPLDEASAYHDIQRYYDDATKVGAFVRAGSDRFGTWLAGALRSDLNDLEIQHMRTHPPSGDWRPAPYPSSQSELIAAFSVPIGGFPIRRALVASADGKISAIITAPLQVEEELGYRRRRRKKAMLHDRLVSVLGHRLSPRERMRKEKMAALEDSDDAA